MNARRLVLARERALRLSAVRIVFRALCAIAPGLAARIAERIWFTPPRPPLSPASRAFLATGQRFDVAVNGRSVAAWQWGALQKGALQRSGEPAVILMHGWGGFGAQMESFVAPLCAAGFRAVLFDAPAHGASGGSRLGARRSTFFDFADALRALTDRVGPLHGIIAHSGGCTAAGWAIRGGWSVPAAVFVAPMASPLLYQRMFQQALGLTDAVLRRFAANVERRLEFQWDELEMTTIPAVASTPPALVVHDRDDRETSWREGASIAEAWPEAELLTTTGLGHRRVLRDEAVIRAAVNFVVECGSRHAKRLGVR